MKKRHLLATAAIAVLIGIFLPATAHAAELKDSDESVVQWVNATKEEKTNSEGRIYTDFSFQKGESYSSYDEAVNSLAKFTVDAVTDRASNNFYLEIPFTVVTEKNWKNLMKLQLM